uniref:Protein kinase domain-containing protein n=1 Tax=Gasterosteus aculeatus aculeatus TaxID=481459 RepID=A0AAQ4PP30_GASAC
MKTGACFCVFTRCVDALFSASKRLACVAEQFTARTTVDLRSALQMDPNTFLYDVPPVVIERLCQILDSGVDRLGWRALAVRVVPSSLEVRMLERVEAAGRSPTSELLWSWAQENPRLLDLVKLLQEMGHQRALQSSLGLILIRLCLPVTSAEENKPPVITFQDIIDGTRNFHLEMRISEGHFCDVYRAQIGSEKVAVKLFKQTNMASWKKLWDVFRKEMEIHHMYQHPNILDLLCCFTDAGRYCLVYPYLADGSLFHRLHHQDREPLSWQQRLTIIKGTAKALHHLHTAQPCPVICGSISSANILLGSNLQPKLSSFGIARLRPHSANQNSTVTLDTRSHSNLGYLSEEYIRDGKLSFSLDVYGFGMVIMETVTGRKVTGEVSKKTPLRDLLVTEVEDSGGVDSCLQFLDETAGCWPTAVALDLLRLALDCTASRHRSRPSMQKVLLALSKLLPPPSCLIADQPHSLDDPCDSKPSPPLSIPVEHDEQLSPHASPTRARLGECSQSELTYLSDAGGAVDLYSSWPVQCSCPAESGGLACEDCRANGFTSDSTDAESLGMENAAKERLRNKLSLYDKGLIHTQELFSEINLQ